MRLLCALSVLLLLTGCAHAISAPTRAEADLSINMEDLFKNPDAYRGKTVIVGGSIISARVTERGTTLEVLQKPLDSFGRPRDTDVSYGRFLLEHGSRLDPAIYSRGRLVTVAGEVIGARVMRLGEADYAYLHIRGKEIRLHRQRSRIPVHFGFGVFQSF